MKILSKKNITSLFLALILICNNFSSNALVYAKKASTSGKYHGCSWKYNQRTGTLTIGGKGAMDDYWVNMDGDEWPWECWKSKILHGVIKKGITYVGYNAFEFCDNLQDVKLPNSLTKLGAYSLSDTGINKIKLPSKLKKFDWGALSNTKIQSIKIPASVVNLSQSVFLYCQHLKRVSFAEKTKFSSIGESTFYACTSLSAIHIPRSIKKIKYEAFKYSGLKSITIPKNVESIGSEAFYSCYKLSKVKFKTKKIKKIAAKAFADCTSLTHITIPKSVVTINSDAFYNTNLTNLVIPKNVSKIGKEAFYNCSNLKKLVFSGDKLKVIGKDAFFNISANCDIEVPKDKINLFVNLLRKSGLTGSLKVNGIAFPSDSGNVTGTPTHEEKILRFNYKSLAHFGSYELEKIGNESISTYEWDDNFGKVGCYRMLWPQDKELAYQKVQLNKNIAKSIYGEGDMQCARLDLQTATDPYKNLYIAYNALIDISKFAVIDKYGTTVKTYSLDKILKHFAGKGTVDAIGSGMSVQGEHVSIVVHEDADVNSVQTFNWKTGKLIHANKIKLLNNSSIIGDYLYGTDSAGRFVKLSVNDGKVLWRHTLPKGFMYSKDQFEYKAAYDVSGNYVYICDKHGIFKADMTNSDSAFTLVMPAKESKFLSGDYTIDDIKVYSDQKFYLLAESEYQWERPTDIGVYTSN